MFKVIDEINSKLQNLDSDAVYPITNCNSIAKCSGENCHLKETCYRYLSIPHMVQAYFLNPPFEDGKCEYYSKIDREAKEEYIIKIDMENVA